MTSDYFFYLTPSQYFALKVIKESEKCLASIVMIRAKQIGRFKNISFDKRFFESLVEKELVKEITVNSLDFYKLTWHGKTIVRAVERLNFGYNCADLDYPLNTFLGTMLRIPCTRYVKIIPTPSF